MSNCEPNPNHELNLSRIQSLDFSLRGFLPDNVNPVIIFNNGNYEFYYYLKLQNSTWLNEGGKWVNSKRKYHINDEDELVFTLEGLKQLLEKNKDKILLKYENYSVPLTAQEVGKIIEFIGCVEKKIEKEKEDNAAKWAAEDKRYKEYLKEYNEKMDTLRQERQKLFENQDNGV